MRTEGAAQVCTAEDGSEPEREPCGQEQKGGAMLKVEVPIRGIDEWVLWRFLEKMFGDENFTVVVSFVRFGGVLGWRSG